MFLQHNVKMPSFSTGGPRGDWTGVGDVYFCTTIGLSARLLLAILILGHLGFKTTIVGSGQMPQETICLKPAGVIFGN